MQRSAIDATAKTKSTKTNMVVVNNWWNGSSRLQTCLAYVSAVTLAVVSVALLRPILWPRIITYPWKEDEKQAKEDRIVILAGSYNPPHRGHLAMLEYLSKR
jgi:hypothetical protein